MEIVKNTLVKFELNGVEVAGLAESEPKPFIFGEIVSIQLLPQFAHLAPTGSVNMDPAKLQQG